MSKDTHVAVRLESHDYTKLKLMSIESDRSISYIIREAIKLFLLVKKGDSNGTN